MASTRAPRRRAARDARATAPTATSDATTPRRDPARAAAPRRARAVSFDDELERTIGVADARVDRGDVWELPRTCDRCGLYVPPGRERWSCAVCEARGDAFDLCAGCRDAAARTARARDDDDDDDDDGNAIERRARKRKRTVRKGRKRRSRGTGTGWRLLNWWRAMTTRDTTTTATT